MTCIGDVAIFNVYIPNDGPFSVNLPLKLKVSGLHSGHVYLYTVVQSGREVSRT